MPALLDCRGHAAQRPRGRRIQEEEPPRAHLGAVPRKQLHAAAGKPHSHYRIPRPERQHVPACGLPAPHAGAGHGRVHLRRAAAESGRRLHASLVDAGHVRRRPRSRASHGGSALAPEAKRLKVARRRRTAPAPSRKKAARPPMATRTAATRRAMRCRQCGTKCTTWTTCCSSNSVTLPLLYILSVLSLISPCSRVCVSRLGRRGRGLVSSVNTMIA